MSSVYQAQSAASQNWRVFDSSVYVASGAVTGALNVAQQADYVSSATGTVAAESLYAQAVYQAQRNSGNAVYDSQSAAVYPVFQADNTLSATGVVDTIGAASITRESSILSAYGDVIGYGAATLSQAANTISSSGLISGGGTATVGDLSTAQKSNTIVSAGTVLVTGFGLTWPQEANVVQSQGYLGTEKLAIVNVAQEANTLSAVGGTWRAVTLNFRRSDGTMPAATTFKWAFWDDPTPDLLDTAVDHGTGTIAVDGTCRLVFEHSQLQPNEVGYITLSDTDGSPEVAWRHHSGPVRVS